METQVLPMRVTISVGHGTKKPYTRIALEVTDERSQVRFLEIPLTVEQAGQLVFQRSEIEVEGELFMPDHIGKKRENTTFNIPGLSHKTWDDRKDLVYAFFDAEGLYEEGWIPSSYDLKGHNWHREPRHDSGYPIGAVRYVEVTE